MARIHLTTHLHRFFPHLEGNELVVEASTVAEVVRGLEQRAPGFGFYVCDERGRLRRHVNVFVGSTRVADPWGLSDPVGPDTEVFIMQALSGG